MEAVLLLVMCLNHNLFWWCNWMTFFCFGDVIGGEQVWGLSINLQSNKVTVNLEVPIRLGCDFVSSHINTQIHNRRFSILRRCFHLRNRLLCVFSVKKLALLVNTKIHITKWPGFYSSIRKKLFVAHINVPCGTFICATNKILQIHRCLIIAFFAARNCKNTIFVSTWNLLPLVE